MIVRQLRKLSVAFVVLCAALFAVPAFGGTITGLQYTSSPLFGARTVRVSPTEFNFDVSHSVDQNTIHCFIVNPHPSNWEPLWRWLHLAAPSHQPLQIGHYGNVSRWPFQDVNQPGLDFHPGGDSPSWITGYFDILEVVYGDNIEVRSLAVDFVQFSHGNKDQWYRGSFRYNSSIPLSSVPEPSALLLMASGLTVLFAFVRFRFKQHV